jgi:parallel beta-helix repeat protein
MTMQTVYQLVLSATIFTVLLTGGVLSPRVATAATYYVTTTGSDSNPCSQSRPCRTIAQGMNVLRAGDTLYIHEGTYAESIGSSAPVPSGTSWSNAVIIAGYPGETVILNGHYAGISLNDGTSVSYVVFDNLIIDASGGNSGLFIGCDSHHIQFMNGEIKNSPDGVLVFGCGSYVEILDSKIHGAHGAPLENYGFYWLGHDSVFDGNEVYDNGGYAYHIYNTGANNVSNNIIRNNIIHGNGFHGGNGAGGIILSSGSNNQADNNIVYGNYSGINIDYTNGEANNQVSNNTIYGNTYSGIHIGAGALNTIVQNNIVYQNGIDIIDDGVGTILIDHLIDHLTTTP